MFGYDMIRVQARQRPHAIAIVADGEEITYADLDQRVRTFTSWLCERDIGPERTVGILSDRSPELIVAMIGTMAAGAAFVSVDPTEPAARVERTLRECDVRLVMAGTRSEADALSARGLPCATWEEVRRQGSDPGGPVAVRPAGDHLAYTTFTSGSTGRPKGVMTTYGGLTNYLRYLRTAFPLGPDDVVMPLAAIGFDAHVREIVGPLAMGARVVLLPVHGSRHPSTVIRQMRRHRVTALFGVVPTMVDALAAAAMTEGRPDLRLVLLSGEVLTGRCVRMAQTLGTKVACVNQYGPTECTMTSTYHRDADPNAGSVPIGRPIPGAVVHVLSPTLEPIPPGTVGEVYIGGVGLARGYLRLPALTAARFLPDPFGPAGSRMFRTGDLVRLTSGGNLEFVGRNDDQLKVAGFRVEPGEVEAALNGLDGIRRAVVTVREDRPGEQRLVAYVMPEDGVAVDLASVRRHATDLLPTHMVPTVYVPMTDLPTTRNGKVDRTALPPPAGPDAGDGTVAGTPHEAVVRQLFARMLGVDHVGRDDSFFDLGGHSLLANELLSRVRSTLGVDVSLRSFVRTPTVAGVLAAREAGSTRSTRQAPVLRITPPTSGTPLFCVHPLSGLIWCYADLAGLLESTRPVYGLQARGIEDVETLPGSLDELVDDYVSSIRRIQAHGPYHMLGWSMGGTIAHAMAAQLQRRGEQVEFLAMLDSTPAGHARGSHAREQRAAAVATAVRAELPIDAVALGSLFDRIVDAAVNLMEIVESGTQPVVHGKVLFFSAGHGPVGRADAWRAHVAGPLCEQVIPCNHMDMIRSTYLAEIESYLVTAERRVEER
jgi:amino acid adenylation domain-containing protein